MKITMFANFMDPQNLEMCRVLYEKTQGQFILAATEAFPDSFLKFGVVDYNKEPFVKEIYKEKDPVSFAKQLAKESDALIYAHCPLEYFELSVASGKPVYRLSQHIYRNGDLKHISAKMKASYFLNHTVALRNKPVYLMCLGAYTAQDFELTRSYKNRKYEFGEFTEVIPYDIDELMQEKQKDVPLVVWANDIVSRNHPETFLSLAKKCSDCKADFELLGTNYEAEDESMVQKTENNAGAVTVHNRVSLETTLERLKRADIFVMTCDYNMGWGSFLNRAMNAGCAVLVSSAAGASKMIEPNRNGLLYQYGDENDLEIKLRFLLAHKEFCAKLGKTAFESIRDSWNGAEAGKRLYELILSHKEGRDTPYQSGLCAKAQIVTQEVMHKRCAIRPSVR